MMDQNKVNYSSVFIILYRIVRDGGKFYFIENFTTNLNRMLFNRI